MRAGAFVKRLFSREKEPADPVREKDDKGKESTDHVRARVADRMSKLTTVEILDWADAVGSGVAKALNDYRWHGEYESLYEARQGVRSLMGVLDVLECRSK